MDGVELDLVWVQQVLAALVQGAEVLGLVRHGCVEGLLELDTQQARVVYGPLEPAIGGPEFDQVLVLIEVEGDALKDLARLVVERESRELTSTGRLLIAISAS